MNTCHAQIDKNTQEHTNTRTSQGNHCDVLGYCTVTVLLLYCYCTRGPLLGIIYERHNELRPTVVAATGSWSTVVASTGLGFIVLLLYCYCTVTVLLLYCYYTVSVMSLYCCYCTVIVLLLYYYCTRGPLLGIVYERHNELRPTVVASTGSWSTVVASTGLGFIEIPTQIAVR